ncbi:MAG: YbaK/EbsC family protein [Nanoarchaeota archaeon]|nr:YbaK/EbsC family protein [Nanoarchaeota archaeon]
MDQNLKLYLKEKGIIYKEHTHPAVFTVAESKEVIKEYSYLHTKNLFLKDKNGRFYLVCLPAEKRLDVKLLEKHLHIKKLKFSSPEELKDELNLTPGSVSIFGIIYSKKTSLIIDQEVYDAEKTGFHPNINTATLEIDRKNLRIFLESIKVEKEVIKLE